MLNLHVYIAFKFILHPKETKMSKLLKLPVRFLLFWRRIIEFACMLGIIPISFLWHLRGRKINEN